MPSVTRCSVCGTIYETGSFHTCEKRKVMEAEQWQQCSKCGTTHPRGVVHVC